MPPFKSQKRIRLEKLFTANRGIVLPREVIMNYIGEHRVWGLNTLITKFRKDRRFRAEVWYIEGNGYVYWGSSNKHDPAEKLVPKSGSYTLP